MRDSMRAPATFTFCVAAYVAKMAAVAHGLPRWVGVLLLLGVAVAAIYWLHRPVEIVRERRAKGLCVGCGYDLTGNVSGVCPECGRSR
jgi:hypothetical protein